MRSPLDFSLSYFRYTADIPPLILMILCCKIKTTTTATYGLLSWLLRYFGFHLFVTLCAPACGSPPATPTPPACLPPPSPPSAPDPAPATCHPSLSLSLLWLPFFAAGPLCLYHYHHHHDKTYHHDNHHSFSKKHLQFFLSYVQTAKLSFFRKSNCK